MGKGVAALAELENEKSEQTERICYTNELHHSIPDNKKNPMHLSLSDGGSNQFSICPRIALNCLCAVPWDPDLKFHDIQIDGLEILRIPADTQ